ncbi:hypothetical protein [Mesorhizobium captivum]|uniref:hypothetical protein n=1 Tax=Mesorhizobium captivum TaxID=3072319 RepID=UPI002A2449A3|nr:hypothetical protein [Mesorhizobium sp. VK22B]
MFAMAGCIGEGIQAFNLVRGDGAQASCGFVVPASLLTTKRIDPMIARCVIACKNLGFTVESTIPPGLSDKNIEVAGNISTTECTITKK